MSKVKFVSTGKNPYVLKHVSAETKPGEFISRWGKLRCLETIL